MNELPAGLADAQHILQPSPWRRDLLVALAAVAMFLIFWWLYRRWRRGRRISPTLQTEVPAARSPLATAVDAIRDRARKSHRYRRGCHELALCMRQALQSTSTADLQQSTAREIAHQMGDDRRARLLVSVSDLRFGRRTPDLADLDDACEQALKQFENPTAGSV